MAKWIKSGWLIPLIRVSVNHRCLFTERDSEDRSRLKRRDEVNAEYPSGDLGPLEKRAKVVIAEDGAASGAGFYIAKEKGYFEDYNIEVNLHNSPTVMTCFRH